MNSEKQKRDISQKDEAEARGETERIYWSEHWSLLSCAVTAGWPLRVTSQLTETLFIHSCSERVRLLLQLYRASFCRSPALLSWALLLPSTFQLRLQSDGKPSLATHSSVAVFREEISALDGGRMITLGGVLPERRRAAGRQTTRLTNIFNVIRG